MLYVDGIGMDGWMGLGWMDGIGMDGWDGYHRYSKSTFGAYKESTIPLFSLCPLQLESM